MSRRMTKAESSALGVLVLIGLVVAAIGKIVESIGVVTCLVAFVLGVAGLIWLNISRRRKRLDYLRAKYHDEQIVQSIIEKRFWEGQTSEQLTDSLGSPVSVDHKMLKTIRREVWKYNQQGRNRYGLRITLDGDVVVGWDQKA